MAAALAGATPDVATPPGPEALPAAITAEPAAPPPASAVTSVEPAPPAQSEEHGNIIVSARGKPPPEDPLQNLNLQSYEVVQAIDKAVVAPVASGYSKAVPAPLRHGLHNVLVTLEEPTVFVNYLLQHKIGKAAETLGRTVINLTLGLGGLIDVARRKPFNLPHRVNGFGYTMGFYGVKSGPYLFLPLFGATSVRDLAGRLLDLGILPRTVGKPFKGTYWTLGYGASRSIDDRVELDLVLTDIRDNSADPYISMKKRYLDLRQAEIDALHGKFPPKKAEVIPPVLAPAPPSAP
jgi:phospholipid-binding lipoprotein MlaA